MKKHPYLGKIERCFQCDFRSKENDIYYCTYFDGYRKTIDVNVKKEIPGWCLLKGV